MNKEQLYQAIKTRLTKQEQMSEAFILSAFLAFSGGFQDAYTYIVRDHVFANAQTGNVVLMSTNFIDGQWNNGFRYLLPVVAFSAGIIFAESIQFHFRECKKLHWRQGILLAEILILLLVGFLPQSMDMTANMLVSFSCAVQVQSFRKVAGNSYASTMCIGNLRCGTTALSAYLRSKSRAELKKMLYYYGVIVFFAIGAGIGGNLSALFGKNVIWISCFILLIAVFIMEPDRKFSE